MLEVENIRKVEFKKKRRRRIFTYIFLCAFLVCGIIGVRRFVLYEKSNNIVKYLVNMGKGEYDIRSLQDKRKEFEESLDIREVDYQFDENLKFGNDPKVIVYHHTASSLLKPETINLDHKEKGWGGIGYHFYIRKDGTIYRGRPEECVGAHAIGKNYDSIGICLEGNFEEENITNTQKDSLIKLSIDMIIKYNLEDSIGHRDVYETLCPGKNFPIDEIKEKVGQEVLNLY